VPCCTRVFYCPPVSLFPLLIAHLAFLHHLDESSSNSALPSSLFAAEHTSRVLPDHTHVARRTRRSVRRRLRLRSLLNYLLALCARGTGKSQKTLTVCDFFAVRVHFHLFLYLVFRLILVLIIVISRHLHADLLIGTHGAGEKRTKHNC
jgi:hypothetical protein